MHALQKAGEDGIGGRRQLFTLQRIEQMLPDGTATTVYSQGTLQDLQPPRCPDIPTKPDAITMRLLTPDNFTFAALFGNLLRRISMLTYFHTDTPLDVDFAGLMQKARAVPVSTRDLHWYDWKRYSSRQKTEMHMGGLLGAMQLDLREMDDFWPYLWLGQWTHAGKATSMGLGAYSIEAASLSNQTAHEIPDNMTP